jgi:hypothetical protein
MKQRVKFIGAANSWAGFRALDGIGERHVVVETEESRRKVNHNKPVVLRKKQQILEANWFCLSIQQPTPKVDSFALR